MPSFQVVKKKTGQEIGLLVIPKQTWKRRKWKQGTKLELIEAIDGSLILREGGR